MSGLNCCQNDFRQTVSSETELQRGISRDAKLNSKGGIKISCPSEFDLIDNNRTAASKI